jgi:prefoldin subunit 5
MTEIVNSASIANMSAAATPYYRLITEGKNPRGIPGAKFIENVELFLQNETIESALGALNELYSKYKYMEGSFEKTKNVYKGKIPELEQTLELIKIMKAKADEGEDMYTNYSLCDTIYAKAKINLQADRVALYIGAKSFLEYSFDEALELLSSQIAQSWDKLRELNDDLAFLRTSSITVEVNMARLFNHSVKLKKLKEGK